MTSRSEEMRSANDIGRGKVVAIVSGKGGSGKTMLAVALAQGAALAGRTAVLVDTDFATGGLSYYLTFREFSHSRLGLVDMLKSKEVRRPLEEWASIGTVRASDSMWKSNLRLVAIGDQRRIRSDTDLDFAEPLQQVLREAAYLSDLVIVDCRGGIDRQSLTVCNLVDEILIVVETDTTSIRASQHLADVLSDEGLKGKIVGYALNKVMDDPTTLAKTASSLLGVSYIGSIPFDIEATRSYVQGRIPPPSTLFSRHVFAMLPRLTGRFGQYDDLRVLSPEEFGTVTLRSPEVRSGGIFVLVTALYVSGVYVWMRSSGFRELYASGIVDPHYGNFIDVAVIVAINVLLVAALSDPIKQGLGRTFRKYVDLVRRIAGAKRRDD